MLVTTLFVSVRLYSSPLAVTGADLGAGVGMGVGAGAGA
jgi:hypothetical protein